MKPTLTSGKAQEFLEATRLALDARWHNAASSSAVTAGINAKDALCFALSGRGPASRHTDRLGRARPVGRCRESCALNRHRRADRQRLHHPAKGASCIAEDGVSAAGAVWPDDRGRIQVDPVPFGVAVS